MLRVSTLIRLLERLLAWRRRRVDVRVRVHRALLGAPHKGEAYFINVLNASFERPATLTHGWVETPTKISVFTRPLPVAIPAGGQWETWIETRELPPGTADVEHLVRIALADDTVIASAPRKGAPLAGFLPG